MGGVCSVNRTSEQSSNALGDGGAPPSYFDVAWEEDDESYAPFAGGEMNLDGGAGNGGGDGASTSAANALGGGVVSTPGTAGVVGGAIGGGGGGGGGGGRGSCLAVPRWPALAEEHLARLYDNDKGCRPSPGGGGRSDPLSLMELCVRSICRRLGDFRRFPSCLPREVVDALLGSLTQHRALSCYTLSAFRDCEVTSLALGDCRGVRNGWVRELLGATPCGRSIVTLDLSCCTGLTDTGLSNLLALKNLESASLRHCSGLGAEATLCLSNSPGLERLSLAHCRLLDDAAVKNLVGLEKLRYLELEGCENISDEGLRHACRLPSLTCLNASRCHGITVAGLTGLGLARNRLRRLNLGWCMGLGSVPGRGGDDYNGNDDDDEEEQEEEEEEEEYEDEADDEADGGPGEGFHDMEGSSDDGDGDDNEVVDRRRRGGRRGGRTSSSSSTNGRRKKEWLLPLLPKLELLCLARSGIRGAGLSRLAAGSPLLRDLDLTGCTLLTETDAERLSSLRALESLNLSDCRRVHSVAPGLGPSVRSLSVAETSVGDAEVQRIARRLPGLTTLNLDRCNVGDAGVRALSSLTTLERLNLADTGITDAGMVHLAPLTRLKDLSLFFCHITDAGLVHLSNLTGLVRLNLDTRDVGDAGMMQLTRLRLLESLDVFTASVSDFGIANGLARLPSLNTLEVCSGRLTDRGLYHLSRVKSLTRLNVSQNFGVTAAGVRHVGALTGLRSLNLSSCSVTPASLDSLTGLVNLESLSVYGCRLGLSDLRQLRGKLPNLRVVRAD